MSGGTGTGTMLMSALKTDRDTYQAGDISSKIKAAQQNIDSINKKLENASFNNASTANKVAAAGRSLSQNPPETTTSNEDVDWTSIYKFCDNYEDVEELEWRRLQEIEKMDEFKASQTLLGHNHDHSKERTLFLLPDETKIRLCEKHRAIGNNLFNEGSFERSAEQFKTSLSYYEYIFPDSEKEMLKLDRLRHVCLCNIALCYIRSGKFRVAIESVDRVLREIQKETLQDEDSLELIRVKALYLRSNAYSSLFEFDQAIEDLEAALICVTGKESESLILQKEISNVKSLKKGSLSVEKALAVRIISGVASEGPSNPSTLKRSANSASFEKKEIKFVDLVLDLNMPLEPRLFQLQ